MRRSTGPSHRGATRWPWPRRKSARGHKPRVKWDRPCRGCLKSNPRRRKAPIARSRWRLPHPIPAPFPLRRRQRGKGSLHSPSLTALERGPGGEAGPQQTCGLESGVFWDSPGVNGAPQPLLCAAWPLGQHLNAALATRRRRHRHPDLPCGLATAGAQRREPLQRGRRHGQQHPPGGLWVA